ncbi:hypothetical protein FO519_002761 [Halicephalobus sp. NKZ332]|nr:hypothetical protein FO519_002761 [Halicephalobus sp. NKZ332]
MNRKKAEAKNGVRAIASVLGIRRDELGAYTKVKNEPPPLFPPIHKPLLPSVNASVQLLDYRCSIENEFVMYFNSLETNAHSKNADPVTHRYSDDFVHSEKRTFVPVIYEEFEEDNDYIHAYFDNGEGYHENPSDDNLDEGDGY